MARARAAARAAASGVVTAAVAAAVTVTVTAAVMALTVITAAVLAYRDPPPDVSAAALPATPAPASVELTPSGVTRRRRWFDWSAT